MRINLEEIQKDALELDFLVEENTLQQVLQHHPESVRASVDQKVSGHVTIMRSGKDVFFLGTVTGTLHLQCSRCLADFDTEKEVIFNAVIRSRGEEASLEKGAEEQEEDVFVIEGLEFDPADIIVQELILEIPMKPLCREECPGLCPKCGALKGSCGCQEEERTDPRWQALERLKDKMTK
jgi:uncharacterized protein